MLPEYFSRLKVLDTSDNYFKIFLKEILQLNLEELNIRKNKIRIVPSEIFAMKTLKKLIISGNSFELLLVLEENTTLETLSTSILSQTTYGN